MSAAAPGRAADLAELVLWVTERRPRTLGAGRLLCIDGPTGAGKSVLASAVARAAGVAVAVLHVDDMLDGWDGLHEVAATVRRDVLDPLARGSVGRYRRYDWPTGRFAEQHEVPPVDLLVLEGVGAGDASYAGLITTLVWMDAPAALRLERGVERDGEALRPRLVRWMEDEEELFARGSTRQRADVVVDGAGTPAQRVLLG